MRAASGHWSVVEMAQGARSAGSSSALLSPMPDAAAIGGPTIATYFEAFSPNPSWNDLAEWPPDVFALTNLVLDHTEAYRFAVAPPGGKHWPPVPDWEPRVRAAAAAWRETAGSRRRTPPDAVREGWALLAEHRTIPLAAIRGGEHPEIWETLLTLHAMADQACHLLARGGPDVRGASFERQAWKFLERHGSLSRIDPSRVRITPKTHFASRGITIRSLSRYLALSYESIDVHWRRIPPLRGPAVGPREYNIVLVPWPLEVRASAFRPVEGPLENMDGTSFGFFSFDPAPPLDLDHLARVLEVARREVPRIDAAILPEAAVGADQLDAVERMMDGLGVLSIIAGVRGAPGANGLGRNYVHLGIRSPQGWRCFSQEKHHRWCLDASQIRQYHLSRVLDPRKAWWEAIELPPRTMEIIDIGDGATSAPLVCEDLARMDEVADLLRRIGPTLVVALLLDGPQLPQRWPCRYATVLADEPGSAVLTLTSLGMALRSQPPGMRRSRVVAMWNDPGAGLRQIELAPGASGVLLKARGELRTVWTADGRRHERSTPSITLAGVQQLRAGPDPDRPMGARAGGKEHRDAQGTMGRRQRHAASTGGRSGDRVGDRGRGRMAHGPLAARRRADRDSRVGPMAPGAPGDGPRDGTRAG
jgi:hypothetical protein